MSVPFAPVPVWAILPSGAYVEGDPREYHLEVRHPDGEVIAIERMIDRVQVSAQEKRWLRAVIAERMTRVDPLWIWQARTIPDTRPAFGEFIGDGHDRIWVRRVLRTERTSDCDEDPSAVEIGAPRPCWVETTGFDVFEATTGRYLGEVELPRGVQDFPPPAIMDDRMLAVTQDRHGTIFVKRFRLDK